VQNLLGAASFEGSFGNWAPGNGFMNQQIYNDPSLSKDGSWFAATNTPVIGRSLAQEVSASPARGETYIFRIWLRSSNPGSTFKGTLALWGLGGPKNTATSVPFSVDNTWQEVSISLPVDVDGVSRIKAEIYLDSTGNTLWLDDSMLSRNLLTAASFEGGSFEGWGAGNGSLNYAVYKTGGANVAQHGGWFAATNTANAGGSMAQVVQRLTTVGNRFTGSVWVRSADPAKTFTGTLALWGLGGTTELASVPFTAGAQWQRVQVLLPILKESHTQLKLEIYLDSTDNTLFVDNGRVY